MGSSSSLNDAVDVPTNVFLKFVYWTIRISIDLPIFFWRYPRGCCMEPWKPLPIFSNGEQLHTSGVCMHGKAWATGVWYRISFWIQKVWGNFGWDFVQIEAPEKWPWKMVIYNIWDHMQQPVGHELTNRTYVQKVQILESRWIVLQVTPQKRYGSERSSEIYMPWWSCSPRCSLWSGTVNLGCGWSS